jgi:hypothetical protein
MNIHLKKIKKNYENIKVDNSLLYLFLVGTCFGWLCLS